VSILPGAEPYHHEGGPVGVLLCHGFTGTPQSLRPWAEHLAAAGLTVELPLKPGHGTRWRDLQVTTWEDWYAEDAKALDRLRERCDTVFVAGLSMGGGMALRLAEQRGDQIAGLILVNPSVQPDRQALKLVPALRHIVPSLPPIASDIKKEGSHELGYDRLPVKALYSMTRFWRTVEPDLPKVTQPVLLFHSPEDHVVHPKNSATVLAKISSTDVTDVELHESYHVATLDNDAPRIFDGSLEFITRLTAGQSTAKGAS
jgi:carboxylesterase